MALKSILKSSFTYEEMDKKTATFPEQFLQSDKKVLNNVWCNVT